MRSTALFVFASFIGMFSCTTAPTTAVSSSEEQSVPDEPNSEPVPARPVASATGLGISQGAELLHLSSEALEQTMAEIAATGVDWVRMDVIWPEIQPTADDWNFSDSDDVIDAAEAHGLRILAVIGYRTDWAVDEVGAIDNDAFAAFAARAASRYATRVDAWEIWNEPNLARAWGAPADPVAYADALMAAGPAIMDADPSATVIAGGLAPGTDSGSNRAPISFFSEVYAHGAQGTFDAVSIHPYAFPALPDDESTASYNTWFRIDDLRALMDANGDRLKTIWLTEFGAPTGSARGAVTEERQDEIIKVGLDLWGQSPNLGPLFLYAYRDRGDDPASREDNFGMVRTDGTPKLAYETFLDEASRRAG